MFIYKIYSDSGDKVYIGSTRKKYLSNRWADHCSKYRLKKGGHCASYELFDEYGLENCKIHPLEECEEALRYERERYWISNTPHCVNIVKNKHLTPEEKKQYHAEWFQSYKSQMKEEYKKRNHTSYLKQKDKLSEKILCECGKTYTAGHKKRHELTRAHLDSLNPLL